MEDNYENLRSKGFNNNIAKDIRYLIKDGFSVDKIIKDIDKIDSETISSVHKLMKLGYDISNDELEK